jgi:hypothetical protein
MKIEESKMMERGKRNAFVGIARTPELLSSNY